MKDGIDTRHIAAEIATTFRKNDKASDLMKVYRPRQIASADLKTSGYLTTNRVSLKEGLPSIANEFIAVSGAPAAVIPV